MSRLVIVSNRLPVTINKEKGAFHYYPSAGGLATGLKSIDPSYDRIWIGWPGRAIKSGEKQDIRKTLNKDQLVPVFLNEREITLYYEGFCNETIWPHFHYFTQYTTYDKSYWESYKRVNQKFAKVVIANIRENDLVWIHDYQLMLLPALIREAFPETSIGFFLHIPFPSYEIFRILPWRKDLLQGILGADQIGFHTYDYMRHFLSAAYRICGHEHSFGKITTETRIINVDVFPMGIDYEKYAYPERIVSISDSQKSIDRLLSKGRKLILSIDRLDYTKGIPQRLRVFEQLIRDYPEYRGKVSLILVVVPSRSNVIQYQDLKTEVDTLVGKIDGEFRTFGWSPIQYFYRSFSFADLCMLYRAADIAMITPLRDGMNLVAKEYIASKESTGEGVLILSEMAGAADELAEALIVNPQDISDMVAALLTALNMQADQQAARLEKMANKLKRYTVKNWAESFIKEQIKLNKKNKALKSKLLSKAKRKRLIQHYRESERRLIFLDYDGTLVDFTNDPQLAGPDKPLLRMLKTLATDKANKLVIISGRDKKILARWLDDLNIDMSAEHGAFFKINGYWEGSSVASTTWKRKIRPVLESMVERTPGSFIEEKEHAIAWHYRMVDKELGEKRFREFRDVLQYLTGNHNLQVLEGNKVVEVKNAGVDKGKAAMRWFQQRKWEFVMAIGDDTTDEDTFEALSKSAHTIKVGLGQTAAKYQLTSVSEVRKLLKEMITSSSKAKISSQ